MPLVLDAFTHSQHQKRVGNLLTVRQVSLQSGFNVIPESSVNLFYLMYINNGIF